MADFSMLERNDVAGALEAYAQEWKATGGKVDGDFVQVLYMLQDDTNALGDAIEAFSKAHGISRRLFVVE